MERTAVAWGPLLYRVGVIIAMFGTWQILQSIPIGDPKMIPPPSTILVQLHDLITDGTLVVNATQSVVRILSGWSLAALLGVPIGVAMGSWRAVEETIGTIFHFLRPISPVAWIPLAILLFGFGFGGPLFVVFLAAFYPIVLASTGAIREVEAVQIGAVRTLGASDFTVYREVMLPGAMPGILMGLRIALGNAWTAVMAAEMFGARGGLGYFITRSLVFADVSVLVVGLVCIGALGFLLDAMYIRLMDRLLHWMPKRERA